MSFLQMTKLRLTNKKKTISEYNFLTKNKTYICENRDKQIIYIAEHPEKNNPNRR